MRSVEVGGGPIDPSVGALIVRVTLELAGDGTSIFDGPGDAVLVAVAIAINLFD